MLEMFIWLWLSVCGVLPIYHKCDYTPYLSFGQGHFYSHGYCRHCLKQEPHSYYKPLYVYPRTDGNGFFFVWHCYCGKILEEKK